ncbi:MAG: DUF1684 domain-containing protein [Elusimicrobia bacterium]|nr:DUF1684 domain-containing protein [Elusimicrobiota bacterium]
MIHLALAILSLTRPSHAAPAQDPIVAEILKDREETRDWLKSKPTSYLAAIRRKDFGSKTALTVGSAEDDDVRLDGLSAHHLRVEVKGDKFHVAAVDAAADFRLKNGTATAREAELEPSAIGVGRFTLRFSHQGYPAIIVFDPKSPRLKEYHGIEYFPVDLKYRYVLAFKPDAKPERVAIESTHSANRAATRLGWFEFAVGTTTCRLAAYRLEEPGSGPDDMSVFFRDATTGKQSYKVGRYVEPKKEADGRYVLDFNMAYNPACAFSKHYNCPVPPKENRLSVPILAGERDSHYH